MEINGHKEYRHILATIYRRQDRNGAKSKQRATQHSLLIFPIKIPIHMHCCESDISIVQ